MLDSKNITISPVATIREAIEIVDRGAIQIAIMVDEDNLLLGIITDGDIRRGILNGISIDHPAKEILNSSPLTLPSNSSPEMQQRLMKEKVIRHCPLVDEQGHLTGVALFDEKLYAETPRNRIVLMAGGLGKRLGDLTQSCPKPLLHVGGKPVLESIIERFMRQGFTEFTISLNYKGEMIREHFQDGERMGINISYIHETQPLGTAGALAQLKGQVDEPIIVMNGDLLTTVDFRKLLEFHTKRYSAATMCVREHEYQVRYGIVEIADDASIQQLLEKPTYKHLINAGIYCLSPKSLDLIPENQFFDMPSLFKKVKETSDHIFSFPIHEYWLDIGVADDLQRANKEHDDVFLK